jgi:hypothetical protein
MAFGVGAIGFVGAWARLKVARHHREQLRGIFALYAQTERRRSKTLNRPPARAGGVRWLSQVAGAARGCDASARACTAQSQIVLQCVGDFAAGTAGEKAAAKSQWTEREDAIIIKGKSRCGTAAHGEPTGFTMRTDLWV